MKKFGIFLFVLVFAVLLFAVLRTKKPNVPNINQQKNTEPSVDQIKEPAWWAAFSSASDKDWIFSLIRIRHTITTADAAFLEQIVEQRDGQELRRASAILVAMLRGRFPAIAPRRELLARKTHSLATNGYPENERARYALSILTYADREAASQFVQPIDFKRPIPPEYRAMLAQQLSSINTDASLGKLNELLAAQDDPMLGKTIMRRGTPYVPVEELAQRWQKDRDLKTLNQLSSEWIQNIYEGYPLDLVIQLMGEPQRSGPNYAYYSSKEGPELYLEFNNARQIGGWNEPR